MEKEITRYAKRYPSFEVEDLPKVVPFIRNHELKL